jgi:hypothetical protein
MVATDVELGDAGDGGHEDDSEERADVEDQDLFLEGPGEGEQEKNSDRKEDVAADFSAGALLVRGEVFRCGDRQPSSPGVLTVGCSLVCALGALVRECGV